MEHVCEASNLIGGVAFIALLVFIGLVVWSCPGGHGIESARGTACLSNVKSLAMGLLMYEADHDRLPHRDAWMDSLQPHLTKRTPDPGYLEMCPAVKRDKMQGYGYAFNSLLSQKKVSAIAAPEEVPIVYDSINYSRNASDPVNSLPHPGRHMGKNSVAFADGHAKRVSQLEPSGEYVLICSVQPDDAYLVANALTRAGIEFISDGSRLEGFRVRASDRARAIDVLKRDSLERHYEISFALP
jgi:prepilin-type processing-associated H-X9-DG protein